jgi:hypothetical protein
MWGRVGFWLTVILLAAFWVAAMYFVFSHPTSFNPLPFGK